MKYASEIPSSVLRGYTAAYEAVNCFRKNLRKYTFAEQEKEWTQIPRKLAFLKNKSQ